MESLAERRAFQCRLTPDRALGSVEEAEELLRDRGMLTRTADGALPSLYEACQEDPYRIGGAGFAAWPATKWPWFGELAGRGYLVAAVHRGKSLLVTGAMARLLDPVCRAETARMRTADHGRGLLAAAVRAAVVAPELKLRRWFSWPWDRRLQRPVIEALGISAGRPVISVRQRTADFVRDATARRGSAPQVNAVRDAAAAAKGR
jgi:hypothetical protein